jgi:mono/diheme cytochrome c family protein
MRTLLLLAVPALLAAQASSATRPARTADELKAFYQQHCVRCHGADGSARDATGRKLGGRDFTNPKDNREPDADMAKTIRKGIFFGKVMPSFKEQLSETEALAIITEIVRKAEKGKLIAPQADAGQPAVKPQDPPQ